MLKYALVWLFHIYFSIFKAKRWTIIKKLVILLLLVCFALTSFPRFGPIGNLLSPPELSNEYSVIFKTLKSSTYSNGCISLSAPKSGKHRSSITIFEKENEKYAIAFYKNELQKITSKNELRMAVFKKFSNSWKFLQDVPCKTEEVDKVFLTKNETNKNPYLIVGFNSKMNIQNIYDVYSFNVNNFKLLYSGKYQTMELCDINSDGNEELITVGIYKKDSINSKDFNVENKITDSKGSPKAIINSFCGDKIILWGDTKMDEAAASYSKISIDNKSFNRPSLFVDGKLDDIFFSTEVLVFEDEKLKNIVLENNLINQTKRYFAPHCYDIDNDGCLEIPIPDNRPFTVAPDHIATPYIIENKTTTSKSIFFASKAYVDWFKFSNNKLNFVTTTYIDYSHRFGLKLPNCWKDSVCFIGQQKNETVEFYEFNTPAPKEESKILTICVCNLKDSSEIPPDYFVLNSKGPIYYLAKINKFFNPKNQQLKISQKQIKEGFFVLNDY